MTASSPDGSTRAPTAYDTTARSKLRDVTRQAHERLDGSLRLTALDLTLLEYTDTLNRFLLVYTALEKRIEPYAPSLQQLGLDWETLRKVPRLERDLRALGSPERIASDPEPPAKVPKLDTFAKVMGCLYVLEGATLGGRVISRNLQRALQIGPDNGACFFCSYGAAVSENWQGFCLALERGLQGLPSREQAADAAVATFELFIQCVAERQEFHATSKPKYEASA